MSRRKQSNPKPLKRDEDDWASDGEAPVAAAVTPESRSVPTPHGDPPPPTSPASREGTPPPRLRLKASLATDPALRAAGSPELDFLALPAFQTALASSQYYCLPPLLEGAAAAAAAAATTTPGVKQDTPEARQVPVYMCTPCGIRFSSHSTLDAHQTYYCSHRLKAKGRVDSDGEESKGATTPGGSEMLTREDQSEGAPEGAKAPRTGKQYACQHCSYSADKKVSLNRHMRMHSTSPGPGVTNGGGAMGEAGAGAELAAAALLNSPHLVDRYCQDCDIRFSSIKTFRAHKLHYCSTRHVVKAATPAGTAPAAGSLTKTPSTAESAPTSPIDVTSRTSPGSPGLQESSRGARQPQPFLALPTNPILIVPYSLFQGASLLTGPATLRMPAPDTACLLLPNGTLQPMAQGLLPPPKEEPAPPPPPRAPELPEPAKVRPPPAKQPRVARDASLPLDLSVRKSSEGGDLVVDLEMDEDREEEKENVCQSSPEREDIVCAPSVPLLLSTSSACSTPSPPAVSPALSSSSLSNSKHRRPSGSPSLSPQSPRNGVIHHNNNNSLKNNSNHKKALVAAINHLATSAQESGSNLSQLLLAAVVGAGHPDDKSGLPVPYLPHGGKAPGPKGTASKPPHLPPLVPAQLLLPGMLTAPRPPSSELLAAPGLLPLIAPELALRMASELPNHQAQGPQVLVKQGVSKCRECNIVFLKHENYVAHKKHYCSARLEGGAGEDGSGKPPSPAPVSGSPSGTVSATSPTHSGGKSSPTAQPLVPAVPAQKPTLFQFICAACGIKFTSFDNLAAHQAYYCPKRPDAAGGKASVDGDKAARKCAKCKAVLPADQLSTHQCGGPAPTTGSGWKCPCCDVVSPTASAAQRHMDSHSGVKAFRCTICRYKGNTLRGMRTHIRMHFEKRTSDLQEENYISCITSDESIPSPGSNSTPALEPLGDPQPVESPGAEPSRVDKLHFCDYCSYSSTYKGNVVRHYKLVHNKAPANLGEDGASSSSTSSVGDRSASRGAAEEAESPEVIKQERAEVIVKVEGKVEEEKEPDVIKVEPSDPVKTEPMSISDSEEIDVEDKPESRQPDDQEGADAVPSDLSGNNNKKTGPKYSIR